MRIHVTVAASVLVLSAVGCELSGGTGTSSSLHTATAPAMVGSLTPPSPSLTRVAGAGFTTFDTTVRGCLDSPNGINCNNYGAKNAVYMSGGPVAGGLSDGDYFFAVITPGAQNAGFLEGASGNLSDTVRGGTAGDLGSGDALANRTFTVTNHEVTQNFGTHAVGTSPGGRMIIGLAPFDDTDNDGGVYILALCRIGATAPSQCKFDAFRVQPSVGQPGPSTFGTVSGGKYYDANANGVWDTNEPGIASWPIQYADGGTTLTTDGSGMFQASMLSGDYVFQERLPSAPWLQTGNVESQCSVTGTASCTLEADRTYSVSVSDGSAVQGVFFGNLCLGAGGARTLGYWANRGLSSVSSADLSALGGMCLQDGSGQTFTPASQAQLRSWLLSGNAVNMAYMLSVQLATMTLNVRHSLVSGSALVDTAGAPSANVNGFESVQTLIDDAQRSLCGRTDPRDAQELLKTALDQANNDLTFVQPGPASCPAPLFP